MKISKPTAEIVATGLRTSRPWTDNAEYAKHQPLRDAGYYMFLTWELTVNQIADGLRNASGFSFDRNKFMRECGAHHYACQKCHSEVNVAETLACNECGAH